MADENKTTRAYTMRVDGDAGALFETHLAVNAGARAFGDLVLTLRGGLPASAVSSAPEARRVTVDPCWKPACWRSCRLTGWPVLMLSPGSRRAVHRWGPPSGRMRCGWTVGPSSIGRQLDSVGPAVMPRPSS